MFKLLFSCLLILHGAIHVMGFVKSRGAAVPALGMPVGRGWGVVWLVAAVLLVVTGVLRLVEVRWWWVPAPVRRYLSKVLPEGAPAVGRVFVGQTGNALVPDSVAVGATGRSLSVFSWSGAGVSGGAVRGAAEVRQKFEPQGRKGST